MIEQAYTTGEALGLAVWCHDQAGPYQTVPQPGPSWQAVAEPARQPATYLRNGTAKLLTLFHPASGHVRVQGVTSSRNAVLHPWLQQELSAILARLPEHCTPWDVNTTRQLWQLWQQGLTIRFTLPQQLPPLRMLLILDNLKGHKSPALVLWLVAHGIMPLYTPLNGSWLNMAESMQRILTQRALAGHCPQTPQDIIQWLEAVAHRWNQDPTPFDWQGKRAQRRRRSRLRRRLLAGSGACTRRPLRHSPTKLDKWQRSCQMTHYWSSA